MPGTLPPRSLDTMSDAIAVDSPSGHTSKRAIKAARERLAADLFGDWQPDRDGIQVSERARLLQQAQELRALAERGMKPRAYRREAERLEALAATMDD